MKLLIIFNDNIAISPEKVCIHTGHANRALALGTYKTTLARWARNSYKNVLLKASMTEKLIHRILLEENKYYEIRDAGLDGVFEPNTLLGYAVLVENDCDDFKRLRTLKF